MERLRNFFKQYVLWVGLLAVVIPLLIILGLQYWSLVKLEEALPAAGKAALKNYLLAVSSDVQDFYQIDTREILNVPAGEFVHGRLSQVGRYFQKKKSSEARRLFVTGFNRFEPEVLFYNSSNHSMEVFPDSPETRVVNVVCAPWRLLSKQESKEEPTTEPHRVIGFMIDSENRILLNPIIDESSKLVGMAGMIVDISYFKKTVLPKVVYDSLGKFFSPREQENLIVTVYDCCNRLALATQPVQGKNDEVAMPLPFIFRDWHIGIRSRYLTPEQWASRYFRINLSLSIFMTLVLIGGIVLALRTASREMKLSQMKADFVSNVSHELRTPLSSIRVFGEFLKLGRVPEPEKVCEYGEYIETESRRLTQLINNILDFSKIESGRKTYQFKPTHVEDIVAETLNIFKVSLKEKDFSIVFQPPENPLPLVVIDYDAIAQAFMNLLDNAIKYSGTSREIFIRLAEQDGHITFSVIDHGIGIPKAEQEKIFQRFHRVSTGLVHDVKGSGLGLALVKHIVEAHGGKVTVESEPGRGSTFTIHLPVAQNLNAKSEDESNNKVPEGETAVGLT